MSQLDHQTILNLSRLSRIQCTQAELDSLLFDVQHVIDYIEQLDEIDTTGVVPCNHVIEEMLHFLRADEAKQTMSCSEFLGNSPEHVGGMLRVPNVL